MNEEINTINRRPHETGAYMYCLHYMCSDRNVIEKEWITSQYEHLDSTT